MCTRAINYPISLVASSISTVYFRTASEYYRDGVNLADFTFKLVAYSMLAAFFPLLITIFYGADIFSFILGENWREAGKIASIVIYEYVLSFCFYCTSYCRVVIGRQRMNLGYAIFDVAVMLACCLVVYNAKYSLINTIIVFSCSRCIVYIIDMCLNFHCLGKNLLRYVFFIIPYSIIVILCLFFMHGLI